MSDAAKYLLRLRSWVEGAVEWSETTGNRLYPLDVWAFDQLRLQGAHLIGFMAS